jgi:hypothetical protein
MIKSLQNNILKDRFRIISVDEKLLGRYDGMNYYANKELRQNHTMKEYDVLINRNLYGKKRKSVIKHELIERNLMKKGMKYRDADRIATKYESQ